MSRLILTLFLFAIALLSKPATAEDWSRFRGPDGSGATSATGLALTWDDGKNIRWQAKLPGRGASSVIIVGKRAFITCYSGYGLDSRKPGEQGDLKLHVACYDAESGKQLWDKSFASEKGLCAAPFHVEFNAYRRTQERTRLKVQGLTSHLNDLDIALKRWSEGDLAGATCSCKSILKEGLRGESTLEAFHQPSNQALSRTGGGGLDVDVCVH